MRIISLNRLLFILIAYNTICPNIALAETTQQLGQSTNPHQLQPQEIKQLDKKAKKSKLNQLQGKSETLNTILSDIRDELKVPFYESPLITILIGFLLGLIPAWVSNLITNRKEKNQLSYQLAKEWDSYRENRNKADIIFVQEKYHEDFSSYTAEEKTHMHIVIEFFDRVDMARENKMINVKAVKSYLSRDYIEWEDRYFQHQRNYYSNENLEESKKIYSNLFKEPYIWLKQPIKDRLIDRIIRKLNLFS